MRNLEYRLDVRNKLIEMLKIDWVSSLTIQQLYNFKIQARVYRVIDGLNDYPIAEEKRGKYVYFKIMNKEDYE